MENTIPRRFAKDLAIQPNMKDMMAPIQTRDYSNTAPECKTMHPMAGKSFAQKYPIVK